MNSGTTSGKGDRFLKTSPGLSLSVRFPPLSRPPSPNPNPSLSPQSLSELPVLPSGLEEKPCQPLGPLIGPHLRCNSCHLRVLFQQLKIWVPVQWHLPCFSDSHCPASPSPSLGIASPEVSPPLSPASTKPPMVIFPVQSEPEWLLGGPTPALKNNTRFGRMGVGF